MFAQAFVASVVLVLVVVLALATYAVVVDLGPITRVLRSVAVIVGIFALYSLMYRRSAVSGYVFITSIALDFLERVALADPRNAPRDVAPEEEASEDNDERIG